ncbi:hypothetical protein lerEdw1_009995 [Lerista edwardsae]|nr:hypothetical protein lerEdw1_009995 [Lerista edwardsae]
MPAKRTRKPNSVTSSPASDQPGASEDVAEEMCQSPPAKAMNREALVPQRQERPYSPEMLSLWNNARWYQIPLSSLRRPKAGLFSCMFQASLQAYQQLRKTKRLKVGRPFSVLPLPDLPSLLTDCAQGTSRKQHDRHSCSRARGTKGHKSLACRKGLLGHSQRMPARAHKHRALAPPLPKRYVVCSGAPHQREEEEPRGASGANTLHSDPGGFSPLSSPDCARAEAVEGGRSASLWTAGCSPLGEEGDADVDMFPPDWTPPRVEFLYYEDLPVLSPAPGYASDSRSSGEMPDLTKEPLGPQAMACAAEAASSTGDHSPPLAGAAALQSGSVWEIGSGDGAGSAHPAPLIWGAAKKQPGGGSPAHPLKDQHQAASEPGRSPSPSAVPPRAASSSVCSPRDLSPSSEERVGSVESLAVEAGEAAGPERPPLLPPIHHVTRSRTASRCCTSASSEELSSDPESLVLGSDLEEDLSDSDLVPLSDLFDMRSMASQSTVELSEGLCSASDSYLSSLDKLLEEKREQTWEEKELERSLGENLLLSNPLDSREAADRSIDAFPEAHRLLLEQFSISRGTIPGVHPGEIIFLHSPFRRSVPSLDTAGLNPRNLLESLFFRQMAIGGVMRHLFVGILSLPPLKLGLLELKTLLLLVLS